MLFLLVGRQVMAQEAPDPSAEPLRQRLVGRPAPSFEDATVLAARPAKVGSSRGQVVLLEFWATWCRPCVDVLPQMTAWHRRWARQGLRIVAITNEKRSSVARFVAARRLPYTIALIDTDVIPDAYLVESIPMFVVIDRAGIVREIEVGSSPDLGRIKRAIAASLSH